MGRLADDYALVPRAGDTIEADLARNLFGEADIPCLSHGPDFDLAELGIAAQDIIRGTNLYEPTDLW
jgi:hypothetical protein